MSTNRQDTTICNPAATKLLDEVRQSPAPPVRLAACLAGLRLGSTTAVIAAELGEDAAFASRALSRKLRSQRARRFRRDFWQRLGFKEADIYHSENTDSSFNKTNSAA